jgi:hypothetical protein
VLEGLGLHVADKALMLTTGSAYVDGCAYTGQWRFGHIDASSGWYALCLTGGACQLSVRPSGLPLWMVYVQSGQVVAARDVRRMLTVVEFGPGSALLDWTPPAKATVLRMQAATRIAEDDGSYGWSKARLRITNEIGKPANRATSLINPERDAPHGYAVAIEYVLT